MKNLVLSMILYGVLLRTGYFGEEAPPPGEEARIRVMVVLHRLLEIQARRDKEGLARSVRMQDARFSQLWGDIQPSDETNAQFVE